MTYEPSQIEVDLVRLAVFWSPNLVSLRNKIVASSVSLSFIPASVRYAGYSAADAEAAIDRLGESGLAQICRLNEPKYPGAVDAALKLRVSAKIRACLHQLLAEESL